MDFIKKIPATVFLLFSNILVFAYCYYQAKTFSEPAWSLTLLRMGAEFNPLTLDKEWYRIFTHMFLHGHLMHLAFNMYALFSVGSILEQEIGTKKFIWVYVLAGIAAALTSLYWNLFEVGVGASGAIFGLFGFSVVLNAFKSHRQGVSVTPILINFALFLIINLLFAKALHADNAAHMGGLIAGAALAGLSIIQNDNQRINPESLLAPILVVIFFLLPRYQVQYYHFFEKVWAQEDSSRLLFSKRDLTDEQLANGFKKENAGWGSTLKSLNTIPYLPIALHLDTFKLKHYIQWRKKENDYRVTMIENESYIYMDSIEYAGTEIRQYLSLDYLPRRLHSQEIAPVNPPSDEKQQEPIQVWYDETWTELPSSPGKFYRIGVRDSLGHWQGKLRDYYANGDVQMKGEFHNSEHDGIFIYYSNHHTYESAGRYRDDRRIGKWENFHSNGKLESEEYYRDGYFLKNYWDSTGAHLVKDGFGHVIKKYSNGVIAEEGNYRDGRKQDLWIGRHSNGQLYYEEYFINGRLTRGRSQNPEGKNFVYDESSFFPTPEGGRSEMETYLLREANKVISKVNGHVRLSFRVTLKNTITDIKIEKSLNKELDEKAKEILVNGPRWRPGHDHGFTPIDGISYVVIDFGKN
ncbi:MAG TPA: rhomboid family intramembrane serine protease [Cyclobacteriaceae bacterium]|jgi:membrane associated rhomboid family serine protease|nr:rhomboid family intramembrane serine protease [Cyclobacteriaceae bacterium]